MTFPLLCIWYVGFIWFDGFLTGTFGEMESIDKGWKTFVGVLLISMVWPIIILIALYEKLFIDNKEKAT